jgi:hypothetical protein
MSRSEKYAQAKRVNLIIAIFVAISLIMAFSYMPKISGFWSESLQNKLLVIGLVVFSFIGSLWNYSKPYWRLRDKMVDSVSGQNAGTNKKVPLIIAVLLIAGLVTGLISVLIQTLLSLR